MDLQQRLLSITRRLTYSAQTNQWSGHFQPAEALLLYKHGANLVSGGLDRARSASAAGRSEPSWYYFTPATAARQHPIVAERFRRG